MCIWFVIQWVYIQFNKSLFKQKSFQLIVFHCYQAFYLNLRIATQNTKHVIQNAFSYMSHSQMLGKVESGWWRADFQSGSGVLKKVFWTFSYLYLWHTMWFYAKTLLKTLKFWKSLNSLCKSGSRSQKSPKMTQFLNKTLAKENKLF